VVFWMMSPMGEGGWLELLIAVSRQKNMIHAHHRCLISASGIWPKAYACFLMAEHEPEHDACRSATGSGKALFLWLSGSIG